MKSRTLAGVLMGLLVMFSACNGADEGADLEMPDTTLVGDLDMRAVGEADTIDVALSEYAINMPSSIAAGNRVFRVANTGSEEHSFEIEGMGGEDSLATRLAPGDEGTVRVQLDPGSYDVYCPVGDHAERGMRTTLQVTEDHRGTVGDTAAGAAGSPQLPGQTQ